MVRTSRFNRSSPFSLFVTGEPRSTSCGTARRIQMFLWRFPALAALAMSEVFPLECAREAFEKMMAAKTHSRAVLSMSK